MTTYVLSLPPSTNHLFFNVKGRGRVKSTKYRAWIKGEMASLIAQRAKPITGKAAVSITIPKGTRGDMDNRIKPTLDLLVRAGILADDSAKHVGSISMTVGDVQMMHVEIKPIEVKTDAIRSIGQVIEQHLDEIVGPETAALMRGQKDAAE